VISDPTPRASVVKRTGVALVEVGEIMLARKGDLAQAEAVLAADRTDIHYHFPVEIHVVDLGGAADPDMIADHTLERLLSGLHGEQG